MRGAILGAVLALAACGKTSAAPPGIVWYDVSTAEAILKAHRRPVLVFCFAEWSVADKELEQVTFKDPTVRGEMQDFLAVKVDLTDDEDPVARRLAERFKVVGVPTIVVLRTLDPGADEFLRLNEFVKPEQLAPWLAQARHAYRITE